MKKLFSLMTGILMVITALTTLTSCDDDSRKAFVLDGTWTGTIGSGYADRWGLTSNSIRTAIHYDMDSPWGGTGYEVDFDTRNPYAGYYYSEFSWSINNGVIRMRYADNWDEILIYDYNLEIGGYFEGYMDTGQPLRLVALSRPCLCACRSLHDECPRGGRQRLSCHRHLRREDAGKGHRTMIVNQRLARI